MSAQSKLIKIVLPLLILALAVVGMRLLIASREEPKKEARKISGALVETLVVTRGSRAVKVIGTGTVQPFREITLTPQVGGRLVEVSTHFVAGGFFQADEVLLRIEEADYRLAVDKARATLAKAEYELANEKGLADVARREWERMGFSGEQPSPLVLREPQLKNAGASLLSARATLGQAELNLERTLIRAPFDGLVRAESVDSGQVVRAGTAVATLIGSEQAEVVVPLPLAELDWLDVPHPGRSGRGASADIQLTSGDTLHRWSGRLDRVLGEVDSLGRMARVVIKVEDPYGLQPKAGDRPALAIGTFVEVILNGRPLDDVVVLPAAALRDDQTVWVDEAGLLKVQPVEVLRRTRDEVVIGSGLESGDQIVLTYLPGAAPGMKLRPIEHPATMENRP
jgi:RND family efflux transporter MFP subunit